MTATVSNRPPTESKADSDLLRAADRQRRWTPAQLPGWLLSGGLLAVLIAAWEIIVRAFDVPEVLVPAPSKVLTALVGGIQDGSLLFHTRVTLTEILVGFALGAAAALVLAFLVTQSRIIDKAVFPLVVITQTIPKVAIAPLLIVWFGQGIESKVLTTALLCFFPLLINAILGLRSTDPDQIAMFRAFGASRSQILTKLQLKSALPSIFAGLDVAVVFSVTGAIVAEFVGSTEGLGYLIQTTNFSLNVALTFAILVVLSIIGLVLHMIVVWLGRKVVFWSPEHNDAITGA